MKVDCLKLMREQFPMLWKYHDKEDWDGNIDFETPEDEAEYKRELALWW